jgi:hypothetical protein
VQEQFSKKTVVGEVPLARTSSVRVTILERPDGGQLVDIRRFMATNFYTGPTKKGVAIGVEKLDELLNLLRQATKAA